MFLVVNKHEIEVLCRHKIMIVESPFFIQIAHPHHHRWVISYDTGAYLVPQVYMSCSSMSPPVAQQIMSKTKVMKIRNESLKKSSKAR